MMDKRNLTALSLYLLAVFLAAGLCEASLPARCFLRRPVSSKPCDKSDKDKKFFFQFNDDDLQYRCKRFGICSDDTAILDRSDEVMNYFNSRIDCENACIQAVECPEPQIENGYLNEEPRYVGYTARYSCNDGYRLVGKVSRTCLPNGTWSDENPTCEVQCTAPPVVANATIQPVQEYYNVGSKVMYVCNEGLSPTGEEWVCQESGLWTGPEIECRVENEAHCAEPIPIDHGVVNAPDWCIGCSMSYSCDAGYILVGPAMRTCLASQEWSSQDQLTHCTRIKLTHNGDDVTNTTLRIPTHSDVQINCVLDSPISGNLSVRWGPLPLPGLVWLRRGSLNIDNIVKYLEGRYICHIGTFSAFVEVVVDDGPECTPEAKPAIISCLKMPSTPFGQVDITCVIFGCPRPEVGWYRDGYLIEKSNLVNWTVNERIEGLSITTLTIHNFSDGDEGTYSCTGTNTIDMAFWDTELLNYRARRSPARKLRKQREVVTQDLDVSHLCDVEPETVTMVVSMLRPSRKVNNLRAYLLDVHRVVRDFRTVSLLKHVITATTLRRVQNSTRLKKGETYIVTGVIKNNVLHISQNRDSVHLYSRSLEKALQSC